MLYTSPYTSMSNLPDRWGQMRVVQLYRALRVPVRARHAELSLIASLDDSPGAPTPVLVELALAAARRAMSLDLSDLEGRSAWARTFVNFYPGEHYRLLAALVERIAPRVVLDIGTYTGVSALAMSKTLPEDGRLVTYDIVPWRDLTDTALRSTDFDDGRIAQRIGDLAEPTFFQQNVGTLKEASLIFLDGPKDGMFEPTFISRLIALPRANACVLVVDDIRLWKMLGVWRAISQPKFDATSIGHWSGTGICLLPPSSS